MMLLAMRFPRPVPSSAFATLALVAGALGCGPSSVSAPVGADGEVVDLTLTETRSASPVRLSATVAKPEPVCPEGMSQVLGGAFQLRDGRDATVGDFCLDLTEVTVEAYAACVKTGACTEDVGMARTQGRDLGIQRCNWFITPHAKHPMNCVDWPTAAAYCEAQGGRLPTEEEWEWAARGGSEARPYPWGVAEPEAQLCWSRGSKRNETCAAGTFPEDRGRFGQLDLAGNVSEWTASDFDGQTRVTRGGDWYNWFPRLVAVPTRDGLDPMERSHTVGFRCAR
jgi:formylglycine-generating enzyme required for sulfatase activity